MSAFREIEHTADLGIEVTALSSRELFSAAAEALFALIADPAGIECRRRVQISATGKNLEELFHTWLCELLGSFNVGNFVAKECRITKFSETRVEGSLGGETLDLARHAFHTEIKGVTYHDFRVWEENGIWRARVIFDV